MTPRLRAASHPASQVAVARKAPSLPPPTAAVTQDGARGGEGGACLCVRLAFGAEDVRLIETPGCPVRHHGERATGRLIPYPWVRERLRPGVPAA